MISTGIDLVKIDRFESLKDDDNFMKSYFNLNEINYIKSRNNNTSTIAGIFAAKEAFLKAIKKGLNFCPLKDIEISHDSNGAPFIIINNMEFLNNISLSISHDGDFAIAIVIIC